MDALVAVDWGTSSLRAARIAPNGDVVDERSCARGILSVPAGGFPSVLQETCGEWLAGGGALCLVSGMAGSKQGWQEAPYCACPAGFGEVARGLSWIDAASAGLSRRSSTSLREPLRIALVPGLSCEHDGVPDVIRGEETQVFGAMDLLGIADGTFVLPGTHSKWVRVQGGRVQSFATFMSGEFYAVLRRHSILARTLPAEDPPLDTEAFLRGVRQARASGSLLASAFSARALALFEQLPQPALASYLSGLVIGEELRAQQAQAGEVVLIGSPTLTERYALALREHGCEARSLGSQATWRGLWALARTLEQP